MATGRAIYVSSALAEPEIEGTYPAAGFAMSSVDFLVPLEAVLSREYQRGIEEGRQMERAQAGGNTASAVEQDEREARTLLSAIENALKVLEHDRSVALGAELERALEAGGQHIAERTRAEGYAALANVELNRSMRSGDQAEISTARLRAREFLGRARDATRS